ncbi:hypothetical protein IFDJLNFL_5579 [Methylobacterium dankookense]|uniref:Uncharacterized protein n=1 Tax=Methylobacterium dankookense TaxID=560405 RepID=A0ABQ4RRI9_9HYPH|nr:hypothetical protein IFDJLNFL_5579 [Methylobacterium dankookense]
MRILTKPPARTAYSERITQVIAAGDLAAILVKMSDNEDNLGKERTLKDAAFLRERYAASFARLKEAAATLGYTGA